MRTARTLLLFILTITLVPTIVTNAQNRAPRTGTRWITYDEAFPTAPPTAPRGADAPIGDLPNISGWLDDGRYLEMRTDPDGERRLYAVGAADGRSEVYRDYASIKKDLPKGFDPA